MKIRGTAWIMAAVLAAVAVVAMGQVSVVATRVYAFQGGHPMPPDGGLAFQGGHPLPPDGGLAFQGGHPLPPDGGLTFQGGHPLPPDGGIAE
jgi:hypothetical protein